MAAWSCTCICQSPPEGAEMCWRQMCEQCQKYRGSLALDYVKENIQNLIFASLFEYLKGISENHHSESLQESHSLSTQSSPMPHPHPRTEIVYAQNLSLSQMFSQRTSVSGSSALKLTCRKVSRCLFLGLSLASSSLSWVPLPHSVAYPSPFPVIPVIWVLKNAYTDQTVALEVILSSWRAIPG